MIPGIISGVLHYTEQNYNDSRTQIPFRKLVHKTDFGFDIDVIVDEEMFEKYKEELIENGFIADHKFVVDGEIRSVDVKKQEERNLTNLYIKAKAIYKKESKVNLFYFNGFCTHTNYKIGNHNIFKVAANKVIVNSKEKKSKSTYAELKVDENVFFQAKDILQGSVKLIAGEKGLMIESLYMTKNSECAEILKKHIAA